LIVEQNTFFPDLTNLIWSQIDQTLMANCLGPVLWFWPDEFILGGVDQIVEPPHKGAIENIWEKN
jgi:hypothetical protein